MQSQVGLRKHHYKANEGDGIPVEIFQIQNMMLWKCCTQYTKIWKTQQWPQDLKRLIFIPNPKKGNAKECSNYRTIALISHTRKIIFKNLQARLQQYVTWELPAVQAGFRKGRGTRDQIANINWIIEKATDSRKTPTSALLMMPKPLTVWITTNLWKFLRDGNTRPPDLPPEKSICRSRSNS